MTVPAKAHKFLCEMTKRTDNPIYPDKTLDPPVPRMALKHQGFGSFGGAGNTPLPPPTEPGVLPPEDSRLWLFVPKAIQRGEDFILDDTREWFEERGRKVSICREYPDHPRWVLGSKADTMRGALYNKNIVSEVHMLARLTAGLPEVPPGMYARLTVQQTQADLGFKVLRATRKVFEKKGLQAINDFADRQPGQFVKFVGSLSVPKRLEFTDTKPTETLDPATADKLIEALTGELQRREREMKIIAVQGGHDYNPVDVVGELAAAGKEMLDEAAVRPNRVSVPPGSLRRGERPEMVVEDAEIVGEAEHEWD